MCGRFAFYADSKTVEGHYHLKNPIQAPLFHSHNIAPGASVPAIRRRLGSDNNELSFLRWGLVPSWAKDTNIGFKLINARLETVLTKPSFKDSFLRRRCLIPASGYYEWSPTPQGKKPYFFTPKQQPLFSLAAVYDTWTSPDGRPIDTFAIITTTANSLNQPIHDRMPVIIPSSGENTWLDLTTTPAALQSLLSPFPSSKMTVRQVTIPNQ